MGLFGQIRNTLKQEQIVEISQMEFRRYDDFAGTAIQRFADVSLPRCPLCGGYPFWKIHIANITTSMLPIQEVDRYYHLKCQCCGGILHTKYHAIGSSLPSFVINPSPYDGVTRMTVDEAADGARFPKGQTLSILELNQNIL